MPAVRRARGSVGAIASWASSGLEARMAPGREPTPAPGRSGPLPSYLALPSRDLGFLKNTLRIYLKEEKVAEVLRAFGVRCGVGQVIQSRVESEDPLDVGELIPAMSAQIGLAKIKCREVSRDHVAFELTRVAEVQTAPGRAARMDFTQGFIEGAVAYLVGRRVRGHLTPGTPAGSDTASLELRYGAPILSGESSTAKAPKEPATKSPGGLEPGGSYLLEAGKGPDHITLFAELARGRTAIALTATRTEELRRHRDLAHVPVFTFTAAEMPSLFTLDPREVAQILETVDDFLKRNPGGVLLLTDLPALIETSGLPVVTNFLTVVAELVAAAKGTLVVSVRAGELTPAALAPLGQVLRSPNEARPKPT